MTSRDRRTWMSSPGNVWRFVSYLTTMPDRQSTPVWRIYKTGNGSLTPTKSVKATLILWTNAFVLGLYCEQARREQQECPGKHFRGAWGEKFYIFLCKMVHSDVFLYFWVTAGPPKRRGARGSLPPTPPSRRAWMQTVR